MSVQVKRRRDTAANLAAFIGAQAELIVDTTDNRVQVHDGVTAGGWPAAKLSEVLTNTRASIANSAYTVLATDRTIAFTSLTAPRIVTLPPASSFPTGTILTVTDETGACSATKSITLVRDGSDTIDGATSAVIATAYGYLCVQSNGAGKWTIVGQAPSNLAAVGIGTAADPTNPLSVYATNALFASGGDIRIKLNKAASANTASFLYQDGWSGRAEIGLTGDDNFHFKVSADGTSWHEGININASNGVASFPSGAVQNQYVVSGLPAASSALTGAIVLATNGRKSGEGTGAGTGCPAWCDGSHWRTFYDNSIVAA